jgi:hypothetical protein
MSCYVRRLLHDDQKESGLLPVLARLVKQFVFKFQSKEHAKDIVQALHVVLRLLERLTKQGGGLVLGHYCPSRFFVAIVFYTSLFMTWLHGSAESGGFLVRRKAAMQRRRAAKRKHEEKSNGVESPGGKKPKDPVSGAAEQPEAEEGQDDAAGSNERLLGEDESGQAQSQDSEMGRAGDEEGAGQPTTVQKERDRDPLEELHKEEEVTPCPSGTFACMPSHAANVQGMKNLESGMT